jgi:hypothetical protein
MKARHYLIQSSGSQPTTGKSATKSILSYYLPCLLIVVNSIHNCPPRPVTFSFKIQKRVGVTVAIGVGRQVDDVTEFWILEEEREEHRWNGEKKILLCFRKDGCIMHACTGLASTDKLHEPSQGA